MSFELPKTSVEMEDTAVQTDMTTMDLESKHNYQITINDYIHTFGHHIIVSNERRYKYSNSAYNI